MVSSTGATSRTLRMRSSEIRISPNGIWPPTSPVLPPWGVIATPLSKQILTTFDTSSVVLGRTRRGVWPFHLPRHSVRLGSSRPSSWLQPASPTTALIWARTSGATAGASVVAKAEAVDMALTLGNGGVALRQRNGLCKRLLYALKCRAGPSQRLGRAVALADARGIGDFSHE